MSANVLIVGGGLAGLSAAVALAERGFPCTLLESRSRLGGRASSFHDPTSGSDVDNCQHVTMGCCTNFRHFCETTGLAKFFHREPTLYFAGPSGEIDRFQASLLPAPFHLAGAFARLSYLSWSDKICLARGLWALARPMGGVDDTEPFSEWLRKQAQTESVINRFWFVVLVSALSESLDRISVAHARKVFVDGFLAHRDGWSVDIPIVPLERLYGGQLTEWLTAHGVTTRLQTSADQIELADDKVVSVRVISNEQIFADEFVVALPFFRVMSILPEPLASHPQLAGINQLEPAPISSVHLWFDRPITELRHAVFVDRISQWVFNRSAIGIDTESTNASLDSSKSEMDRSFYYQVVISASHELAKLGKEEVQNRVIEELTQVWPTTSQAKLLHVRHVTEHRAVFSPVPGVDALRPKQQSPIENLQLAGDWTQTGWPATMEGAVRSGFLAAQNILRRHGYTDTIVKPDLKRSPLSRLLFGI